MGIFDIFAPKLELVATSLPVTFNYSFESGVKNYYPIMLWIDSKGRRSYTRKLTKSIEELMGPDTYLEYWVLTGNMDPRYEAFFDWKVTPRQLKQRYLADLLKT